MQRLYCILNVFINETEKIVIKFRSRNFKWHLIILTSILLDLILSFAKEQKEFVHLEN